MIPSGYKMGIMRVWSEQKHQWWFLHHVKPTDQGFTKKFRTPSAPTSDSLISREVLVLRLYPTEKDLLGFFFNVIGGPTRVFHFLRWPPYFGFPRWYQVGGKIIGEKNQTYIWGRSFFKIKINYSIWGMFTRLFFFFFLGTG